MSTRPAKAQPESAPTYLAVAEDSLQSSSTVQQAVEATTQLSVFADMRITCDDDYTVAGGHLRACKDALSRLKAAKDDMTSPIKLALDRVNEFFATPTNRLLATEKALKANMLTYQQEQAAIRAEAQRKLEEAAAAERRKREAEAAALRKKAAEAAAKLEAEARAKREAEEAARQAVLKAEREAQQRKTAAAREAAEKRAAAARAEQEASRAAAAALEAKSAARTEKAEAVATVMETQAAAIVAPTVADEAPTAAGVSTRKVLKVEVEDLRELVKAVHLGLADIEFLSANTAVILKAARVKGTDTRIPGVLVYEDITLVSKAG